MPSLNLSLPGMPGLAAGLFPVASNQLPSVTVGGGGDFAAMMPSPDGIAPAEPSGLLDAAPALPPGTALPPIRQIIAGPPEPVAPVPVEDVMIGTATPALPKPIVTAAAPTPVDPEAPDQVEPAPTLPVPTSGKPIATSEPKMGECRVDTWDFHGASRRALARATLQPPQPKPFAVPVPPQAPAPEPVVCFAPEEPDTDALLTPDHNDEDRPSAETPAPTPVVAQPAPPPFAPIDWTRPPVIAAAPPTPEGEGKASSTEPMQPLAFEARRMPARVDTPAKPGPETISTLPDQPQDQASPEAVQSKAAHPQQHQSPQQQADGRAQGQPQATVARPMPLPQGHALPPEIAREIADVVRAAVGERDEAASTTELRESAALPPLQGHVAGPPMPLHRDFTAVHRPVIDTSRAEWMQSMIERIAEMPQVDGKREAQIRLSPDALGTIDVRIEQRQDRLHVTMNAENPQARQLLAEAAPRLQEMAEARGLRLGQNNVGGGESQDRQRPQEQQEPKAPLSPRSARAAAETSSPSDGDLIA